jgi:hypothetical protein
MERLAWVEMVQGQHGRKRYKETFSMGQNCNRKRSAWHYIARGHVQHGITLQKDTFGIEEIAQRNIHRGINVHI